MDPVNRNPDLSIVVLCYRSGQDAIKFVSRLIAVLDHNNISCYEIVLVGNYHLGVDDETPHVIKNLARENERIFYIAEPKPNGCMMGWDMRKGLRKAKGRYISIIDGDGQMPVEDLIKVYLKIKNEDFDLVKSYRIVRGDSWRRKSISFVYNMAFHILFPGFNSKDINSKPKIFKAEKYALLDLHDNGWCIDAEIMIQARALKFKIGEIPTKFLGLGGRRKSFVKLPAIFEFARFLILYRMKNWFHIKG